MAFVPRGQHGDRLERTGYAEIDSVAQVSLEVPQ